MRRCEVMAYCAWPLSKNVALRDRQPSEQCYPDAVVICSVRCSNGGLSQGHTHFRLPNGVHNVVNSASVNTWQEQLVLQSSYLAKLCRRAHAQLAAHLQQDSLPSQRHTISVVPGIPGRRNISPLRRPDQVAATPSQSPLVSEHAHMPSITSQTSI